MKRFALLCLAITSASAAAEKHHVLKATPENVQWGWLDPKEPPRLTIESGDTVSIETPRIETKTDYILVGFDEDLMKAFTNALNETIDFLVSRKGLSRE